MLPKLKELIEIDDICFWQTSDNKLGAGFKILHCDLETENPQDFSLKLSSVFKNLDPSLLLRIELKSEYSNSFTDCVSRTRAINEIAFRKNHTYLYINHIGQCFDIKNLKSIFKVKKDYSAELKVVRDAIQTIKNSGINLNPITKTETLELFNFNYDLIKTTKTIESGTESIGILRLIKQSSNEIELSSLTEALSNLDNFSVMVSVRKIPDSVSKILLEKRLKQLTSAKDVSSNYQSKATENSILDQFSHGMKLLEFEFLVTLCRNSNDVLMKDLSKALGHLNNFGDFKIETYGTAESFIAAHAASNQHVTLMESDASIPAFLPLFLKSDTNQTSNTRSLSLHRDHQTLTHFDLFNEEYNCFNALIVGTSGKGKSVLTGLLTRSLLHDPEVNIIKVDVGGSHSKECELYQGLEFKMRLDHPSGINPFEVLHTKASDSEKVGILSKFLSVLILETGEIQFSKDLRSKIEESILEYILSAPIAPSLNDFYDRALTFPRRNLLKRWATGGIYESAFMVTDKKELCNTRLRYYNFSQVFEASDPEFAQAGFAAVLAQFNIDSIDTSGKRLVLICDETLFFMKTCFDLFKFTTANVRKYGHAVVLISQLSTDFIVNNDYGIIENSPQRFLFSVDGKPHDYKERFNLTDHELHTIQNLKSIPGEFSEVYLQSLRAGKKLVIKITLEEYWALTTSKPDQIKIQKLRTAVPELSLSEALKCLSLI